VLVSKPAAPTIAGSTTSSRMKHSHERTMAK
jgi:hypothetical protein